MTCLQCGATVEPEREDWAGPMCLACVPAPRPGTFDGMRVAHLSSFPAGCGMWGLLLRTREVPPVQEQNQMPEEKVPK